MIRFELPRAGHVDTPVFNLLGQRVAALMDEFRQLGTHEVRCDAAALGSGVYFDRIQAGRFVATKKYLLLR